MSFPSPFNYPTSAHARKHGPYGYATYQKYKPWLRDDFLYRCAYCLTREAWGSSVSGHAELGADHFEPKSINPALAATYTNLIYVCNDCNRYRQTEPLPLNPLEVALGDHLSVNDEGEIVAKTTDGQDFIDLFDLTAPGRDRLRKDKLRIIALKQRYPDDADADAHYRLAFGYPLDLPDLTTLEPEGNTIPGSQDKSAHALGLAGLIY